jgi:serine/threonine protein kinase
MAEIYLARQTGEEGFSRMVIVKRILPDLAADPHFRNMLVDEAHIAMTLNHSNVVPVLDLGRAEGSYFLVMELVDGWDLAQVHERGREAGYPFPMGLALYVMAEVCRGLAYAHGRRDANDRPLGIVHRDVSPQNVLLSEHGEVKVTDFGIAKALGKRERTHTGIIKGKLDFMSPEQASGGELDASSDIFAAGTMLYFLATGRRPFASPSDFEALLRVQRAEFLPADQARPGLSPGVARVIAKAMQLRPADRHGSAEELMLDLESVMRQEFGSPGQSQLARWLTELQQRDNSLPVSRRPGMTKPQSLTSRWFAEGEMLSFDDSSNVSDQLGGSLALSSAAPVPVTGSLSHGGPEPFKAGPAFPSAMMPASLPSSMGPGPGATMPRPIALPRPRTSRYRLALMPPPKRRRFLKGAVVALLLVAGAAALADRLLSKEQQRHLESQARDLVKKGVDGVASVIDNGQARPRPVRDGVAEAAPPESAPRAGARAALPDEDRVEKEAARVAHRRRGQEVTITLLSRPAGAQVSGPRGPLGITPVDLTARVGSTQALTFSKPGFEPAVRKIAVDRKQTTVTVELKALGP